MVRPKGSNLEEGGAVGAGGKEQVVWRVRPEGSNLEGAGGVNGRACFLMFSIAACMSFSRRQAMLSILTVSTSMRPNSGISL